MQTIAIDWSGREGGASETIWLARVRDGALVELGNGRDRDEVVAAAIAAAEAEARTAVSLDFAFSFHAWYRSPPTDRPPLLIPISGRGRTVQPESRALFNGHGVRRLARSGYQ